MKSHPGRYRSGFPRRCWFRYKREISAFGSGKLQASRVAKLLGLGCGD